ncbi:MAG: single-stranded-DNA-specific exonuclease RecJ [Phycisphaerales bacterium]|nr:single-stranded-DNA-specific exonuclease RecJ [Phycisphaerales bacterium]
MSTSASEQSTNIVDVSTRPVTSGDIASRDNSDRAGQRADEAGAVVRGLTRLWKIRRAVEVPASAEFEPLVRRVFAARRLADSAAAREFLEPMLKQLHDPGLLPEIDKAAGRLLSAAASREPIVIYGDYDVDGVTATTILFHTLTTLEPGTIIDTYVPHRLDEGYGLSSDAIGELAGRGAKVIVSVDCGVTAVEPARVARERGVDLIITDHHTPPSSATDMPKCFALVHPRVPGSKYPFGDLSGAGVAFKLAWRLATTHAGGGKVSEKMRALLLDLLALAALGTIADVVPLVGENRVIARFGLSRIKSSPLVGMRALVEASGLDGASVSSEDVGFKLGPRLNACGRMGHAREAVEMFTVATPQRANEIARNLTRLNRERQDTEKQIFEHAVQLAEQAGMTTPDRRAIVLAHESWHRGVVGIVCSRLVERFSRPTILMGRDGDVYHGSGRSVEGFSLAEAIEECRPMLKSGGGHAMAAGLSLEAARIAEFTEAFIAIANRAIAPDRLVGSLWVDTHAAIEELTEGAVRQLAALAPFGQGNPSVRVRLTRARMVDKPRALGTQGKHLSLQLAGEGGRHVRVVAWNWASLWNRFASDIRAGTMIEAVVSPKVSDWNGQVEPELLDLRIAE